jgi:D-amino peptidase
MRVYISIDMEGVGGIATLDQVVRGGHGYPRAQRLMTAEANAAIAGAFDAGADTVVVNDSHGTMDNLLHKDLDERARLIFGSPKADCMAEGISEDCDVALFLGYHAPAGAIGCLAHTYSSHFLAVRLNGAAASEAEINALQAAAVGVPIGLLTGDDVICAIAAKQFPGVRTVEVKTALGFSAVDSLSPARARAAIRQAAYETVAGVSELRPLPLPASLELEIDLPNVTAAELCGGIAGIRRIGDRTVHGAFEHPRDVIGFVTVAYQLSAAVMRDRVSLIMR